MRHVVPARADTSAAARARVDRRQPEWMRAVPPWIGTAIAPTWGTTSRASMLFAEQDAARRRFDHLGGIIVVAICYSIAARL